MKKFFIISLLLILIVVSFGYSFLKISANGDEYSYFNTNLRKDFSKNLFLRNLFGLHLDGDGKSDYLGNKYKKIVVAVFAMDKYGADKDSLDQFTQKVEKITGKPTSYEFIKTDIPFLNYSEISALREYLAEKRYKNKKDEAVISLMVVSQLKDSENQIGSTLGENGIILFQGTLDKYMVNENDDVASNTSAVLLHEFGHQLGLGHNDNFGCLMNESTEFVEGDGSSNIIVDFCDLERNEIKDIANNL